MVDAYLDFVLLAVMDVAGVKTRGCIGCEKGR